MKNRKCWPTPKLLALYCAGMVSALLFVWERARVDSHSGSNSLTYSALPSASMWMGSMLDAGNNMKALLVYLITTVFLPGESTLLYLEVPDLKILINREKELSFSDVQYTQTFTVAFTNRCGLPTALLALTFQGFSAHCCASSDLRRPAQRWENFHS